MIIDGKKIATEILAKTRMRISTLGRTPVVLAITVAPNAATESYLKIKSARAHEAGMILAVARYPDSVTEEELIARIDSATEDAIIVQLPLPAALDAKRVLDAIPLKQDADVLGKLARDAFASGDANTCMPPVVGAVAHILTSASVDPRGMRAVVVGEGWLVGNPVASWLRARGATVTVANQESESMLPEMLADADVVVSGAGHARLITNDMVKEGAILIDAGTSESGGQLVGDMDPRCAEVASVFTPVPGGVGPIAVACLFANVAWLVLLKPSGVY